MHRVRDHAQRETIKIFGLGEGHLLWVGWSLLRRTERPQERGRADDSLHAAQPIVLCALANRTNGPDPPDCVTALDTGRISSAPMQIGPLQLLVSPSDQHQHQHRHRDAMRPQNGITADALLA